MYILCGRSRLTMTTATFVRQMCRHLTKITGTKSSIPHSQVCQSTSPTWWKCANSLKTYRWKVSEYRECSDWCQWRRCIKVKEEMKKSIHHHQINICQNLLNRPSSRTWCETLVCQSIVPKYWGHALKENNLIDEGCTFVGITRKFFRKI